MTPKLKTYIKRALMITSMTLARKPHIINTQMIPYKVKEFKSLSVSRQAIKDNYNNLLQFGGTR